MSDKAIRNSKIVRLPKVIWRKRAQMRSFTINAADGQLGLGVTGSIVNILWNFTGYATITRFRKCDVKCTKY